MRTLLPVLLLATASLAAEAAPPPDDAAMRALAAHSGCLTCHSVEPLAAGAPQPIGPPWPDVARKYRGQKDAADTLTRTVEEGSNPYGSHWKDKVTGLAMPPNKVAISEPDARKLVQWILKLP